MLKWRMRVADRLAVPRWLVWPGLADRRGVTAVEYAIIAGIMVVALVLSVPLIGPELTTIFNHVSSEL